MQICFLNLQHSMDLSARLLVLERLELNLKLRRAEG